MLTGRLKPRACAARRLHNDTGSIRVSQSATLRQVCISDQQAVQAGWIMQMTDSLERAQECPSGALTDVTGLSGTDIDILCSNFIIDHCGLLLDCGDCSEMVGILQSEGFDILQRFPSQVLAGVLSTAHQRPVSIDILKLARRDSKMELFLVKSGLTKQEIAAASTAHSHCSLVPRSTKIDIQHFLTVMVRSGMKLAGNGINHQERSKDAEGKLLQGVTVLYFESVNNWLGMLDKLELCVPGARPDLLQYAAKFFGAHD